MSEAPEPDELTRADLETIAQAVASVTRRLAPRSDWDDVFSKVAGLANDLSLHGRWSEIENVAAWAKKIATRRCADAYDERISTQEAWEKLARLRPQGLSNFPEPEDPIGLLWQRLLRVMTPAEARAVFLKARGFTYQEIADFLGKDRGTASRLVFNASRRIRGMEDEFL